MHFGCIIMTHCVVICRNSHTPKSVTQNEGIHIPSMVSWKTRNRTMLLELKMGSSMMMSQFSFILMLLYPNISIQLNCLLNKTHPNIVTLVYKQVSLKYLTGLSIKSQKHGRVSIILFKHLKVDSNANVELWNSYFVCNMLLAVTNTYILRLSTYVKLMIPYGFLDL